MRFFAAVGFVLVLLLGAVVVIAAGAGRWLEYGAVVGAILGTLFAALEHRREALSRERTGR